MKIEERGTSTQGESHPLRGEVATSFYSHFAGSFKDPFESGEQRRLGNARKGFRDEILSNSTITKEDLANFLAEHGVEWSKDQSRHLRDSEGTF